MLKIARGITRFASSQRGAKITLAIWLIAVVLLSGLAPGAKEYAGNPGEGSVKHNQPSEIAQEKMQAAFPNDESLPALVVFHRESGITAEDREKITVFSEWLVSDDKPAEIIRALPYHSFPESVQDQMFSEGKETLLFNVIFAEGLDSKQLTAGLEVMKDKIADVGLTDLNVEVTGPAGIAADTSALFKNADFVLMIATILLIFVLLIVIYRSPLLAITPLIIAAIVYGVVDRVIGLLGAGGIFSIDSQAISIMLVLMFAVLTDYSLFVFSRYRERLRENASKYDSMEEAMHHLAEPISYSGGTIFLAMLALFATVFSPYNHFAAVFATAVVFILLAGLTLIPAMFALLGRRAFWPFIPKEGETKRHRTLWSKISEFVTSKPKIIASILLIVFAIGAANFVTMKYSFNLLKSFPEDMSSRVGFELLEANYPPGELAPVDVLLEADGKFTMNETERQAVNDIIAEMSEMPGVESVTDPLDVAADAELPRNFLSESKEFIQLQIVLADNPYEQAAIDTIGKLRDKAEKWEADAAVKGIHFDGQTAEQADVKQMNKRDMLVLFVLVTVLMVVVLGFQTRSVRLAALMMGTILLSYFASMGFGWWIFQHVLGLDAVSYRLPVYTFVFMVELGIDYNIMLISRIREEAKTHPWKEAVGRGIALTGGVISSAGMILAATFAVLMTQPMQELFLFGFTMGILLDTFIIRGFLMPSLLLITHKR